MMQCPKCESDQVGHTILVKGVLFQCLNCKHGWLGEEENTVQIQKSMTEGGKEDFKVLDGHNMEK